jgi:uncharacterized membrane protein
MVWKLWLIVALAVLVIDLLWLGVLMKSFYQTEVGALARRLDGALSPRWPAAVMVYVLIPAGLVLFVRPAMGSDATLLQALGWGALFGLVLYGVYDFTNRSILDHWPLRLTLVDVAWGTALCGVSSFIMRAAERWLSR